jgi:hypothetical protein
MPSFWDVVEMFIYESIKDFKESIVKKFRKK